MSSIAHFYDRIAPLYGWIDVFLKKGTGNLESFIPKQGDLCILDLGMALSIPYLKQSKHEIWGIDISLKMQNRKKDFYKQVAIMDAQKLSYSAATFDYVIAAYILSVAPDYNAVLREANRVLKVGGTMLVLNHFSNHKLLSFFDQLLQPLATLFKFNVYFKTSQLDLKGFKIVAKRRLGWLGNYEILVLEK